MRAPRRHLPVPGFLAFALFCLFPILTALGSAPERPNTGQPTAKISFYRDIRPILQANCQGCHQPAKAKGGYVMTNFKGLLAGGDTEGTAIVPEHSDQSSLLKMITPQNGEAR